jgi:hypothetical protein
MTRRPAMMDYLKKNWKLDALALAATIAILLISLALSATWE